MLSELQTNKFDRICRKLRLKPGDRSDSVNERPFQVLFANSYKIDIPFKRV